MLAQRERWKKTTLDDESLDPHTRAIIVEALRPLESEEKLKIAALRATNTFPRVNPDDATSNFVVPTNWFLGGVKAALTADGVFEGQARNLVQRCLSIYPYPNAIDLGTNEPDQTYEANVPLDRGGPNEAQATIKWFHLVRPRDKEFTLLLKILDSPYAKPLTDNLQRTLTVVGTNGAGGCRGLFGTFRIKEVKPLKPEKEEEYLTLLALGQPGTAAMTS